MPNLPLNLRPKGLIVGLLALCVVFLLSPTYLMSDDFYKNWMASTNVAKQNFVSGFASGITWRHSIDRNINCAHKATLAAQQEALCLVTHSEKLPQPTSIVRVMEELYADPANAELHYDLIFFVATAKLLGFSDTKAREAVEILRRNPPRR